MRFLTCGADGILVELADLDETLRVFAALQSAVKHAVEQTAESPERAAQPSTTSVFAGVKHSFPLRAPSTSPSIRCFRRVSN